MRSRLGYLSVVENLTSCRRIKNRNLREINDRSNPGKTSFNEVINDMKYTLILADSCHFCQYSNETFEECLVCSHDIARGNVTAHDSSGDGDAFIYRANYQIYGSTR
jgi:hypothetical protein